MYPDQGCHGEVAVGALPDAVKARLARVPGVWLEFETETDSIVVRHAQPTSGPDLPIITGELVQLLAEIPPELHAEIPGGAFFVHTLDTGQFVRIHVSKGGVLELRWAHPDYAHVQRARYESRAEIQLDPVFHRLNGKVSFASDDPENAVNALKQLSDTYEGLYPEGDRKGEIGASGRVDFTMRDLNLDAHLLVGRLVEVARKGTLEGSFDVDSFGEPVPEHHVRILFEKGEVYVQRPALWEDRAAE